MVEQLLEFEILPPCFFITVLVLFIVMHLISNSWLFIIEILS